MVGKRLVDTLDDDMWYFNWTMTQKQHEEFKAYAMPLLKKIFKFNKSRAEETFGWFDLQFGLRIKS
jgi:succinate dehydrogenase flavin-adding protein (antitoxin of CptAB toxin-antitoxin module)